MDRSYPSVRRIERRIRFRQRLMAAAAAGVAACALAFAVFADPEALAAAPGVEAPATLAAAMAGAAPLPAASAPARPVYRHSVVPGGVGNGAELARAVRRDKVVAAHYAGFAVDRARAVAVAAPRAVHVSYRKGDKVYWTARKALLRPGETLLTDGRNELRARCANRISDVPRLPVEADGPGPETLDELEAEGGIAWVGGPEPGDLDLPEPGGRYPIVWGDGGKPNPADPPGTSTPAAPLRPASPPWPWLGWLGAPPRAGGVPVLPAPLPDVPDEDLAPLPAPPLLASFDPSPGPGPFVPPPDPGRLLPPSNPPLDVPPPAHVPEPSGAWLAVAALLAMVKARRRKT